jgi:hypothetical protein
LLPFHVCYVSHAAFHVNRSGLTRQDVTLSDADLSDVPDDEVDGKDVKHGTGNTVMSKDKQSSCADLAHMNEKTLDVVDGPVAKKPVRSTALHQVHDASADTTFVDSFALVELTWRAVALFACQTRMHVPYRLSGARFRCSSTHETISAKIRRCRLRLASS